MSPSVLTALPTRLARAAVAPFEPLFSRRELVWQLTRQEFIDRYRGSVLGVLWSLFTPLVYLAIFTFVFSIVFRARWGGAAEDPADFALILFVGFIVFWLLNDCVSRAPRLVLDNAQYVNKVIFPVELLAWPVMFTALFHAATSLAILVLFQVLAFPGPYWTLLLAPLVVLPFACFAMGICWIVAALGVYFRDATHLVTLGMTVVMYASPIIYPMSLVPPAFRPVIMLNPLTLIVRQFRGLVLWGELPGLGGVLAYVIVGWSVAVLGHAFFQKMKPGFANVI